MDGRCPSFQSLIERHFGHRGFGFRGLVPAEPSGVGSDLQDLELALVPNTPSREGSFDVSAANPSHLSQEKEKRAPLRLLEEVVVAYVLADLNELVSFAKVLDVLQLFIVCALV
jgi:hypothetical protein